MQAKSVGKRAKFLLFLLLSCRTNKKECDNTIAWLDSPQGNIDFDTPYRIRDHWHPITFQWYSFKLNYHNKVPDTTTPPLPIFPSSSPIYLPFSLIISLTPFPTFIFIFPRLFLTHLTQFTFTHFRATVTN